MGRQVINRIKCGNCSREFDVATEDIEWDHLADLGPVDDGSNIRDYGVIQSVTCPYCKETQKIVFAAKGKDEAHLDKMKVSELP